MLPRNAFGTLPYRVDATITIHGVRHHSKASEAYLDVTFDLPNQTRWSGSVPVTYRRTGLDAQDAQGCIPILKRAYDAFAPDSMAAWVREARAFWRANDRAVTKEFFEALLERLGKWVCQGHGLPENPNWARRVQDIKELGYTLATDTAKVCATCGGRRTHLMLLPIPRGAGSGYEALPPELRKRIIKVLGSYDAYEGKVVPAAALLPDHKFPEIRWDEHTPVDNPADMSDSAIKKKFQLLSNQRNEQKREVCRSCYQTGRRGTPFGIPFFLAGSDEWPAGIPKRGVAAEPGCKGCGWYDLELWRQALGSLLNK